MVMEKIIKIKKENNFSLLDDNSFVWSDDSFPFKKGDIFPPEKIREVADVSLTNRLLYEGKMDEVLDGVISLYPENRALGGLQIKEIVQTLPLFSGVVNDFLGLIAGNGLTVDIDSEDESIDSFIEESNLNSIILEEVKSLFLDCNSAYTVNLINSKPYISKVNSKNIIPFTNAEIKGLLECLMIYSIYTHPIYGEVVEFNCYMRDGRQLQKSFIYRKGRLGRHLHELDPQQFDSDGDCISYKAIDGFDFSNVVYFVHNSSGDGSLIGKDIISDWAPSISALCRSLQTLYRAGDEHRERLTLMPEDSIQKDGDFFGFMRNIITFGKQGLSNEPKFISPDLQVESLEKLVTQARKELAADSRISSVFLDIENVGGGLTSGKALKTMLTPTLLRAKLYQQQLLPGIKELIIKLGAVGGYDLTSSKITVRFNETIFDDYKEISDAICQQYDRGLISKEDAILKLNPGITVKQAKLKAQELGGQEVQKSDSAHVVDDRNESIKPTLSGGADIVSYGDDEDDALWETQVVETEIRS